MNNARCRLTQYLKTKGKPETEPNELMDKTKIKLTFDVSAQRVDAHGSEARCKSAIITLDTELPGCADAFNPAELLLAALVACIIRGIERVPRSSSLNHVEWV